MKKEKATFCRGRGETVSVKECRFEGHQASAEVACCSEK